MTNTEENNLEPEMACNETVNEEKKSEVEELTELNQELNNKYLEALAEIQNIKKRNAQEYETLQKYRSQRLVSELIPVLDSFELALSASNNSQNKELLNYLKGFELVLMQVNQILESEGVKFIDALGKRFDPNVHEALAQVTDEKIDNDIVVEQMQKGYILKDRVLRPALVKVNKLEDEKEN